MSVAAVCDVLSIGTLSRNRYWGEGDDRGVRATACTSTLVRADGALIVVDPGHDPETMARLLDDRAGLRPNDVDAVFVTHHHGDHRVGIDAFPRASLLMSEDELAGWGADEGGAGDDAVRRRFSGRSGDLAPGVRLLSTPGHTSGHTSLFVESEAETVVIAGDAVMTRDFYRHRGVFFNSADREVALESLDLVGTTADVVVPGHDNAFCPDAIVRAPR